ncbi:MAG: DUF4230 domain-containing protein [Spirochaetales bacterium]
MKQTVKQKQRTSLPLWLGVGFGVLFSLGILLMLFILYRPTPLLSEEEIQSSIRTLLEFPSVEYRYREILYLGEEKSFLFLSTSSKEVLFSVEVRVQAGFDLKTAPGVKKDKKNPKKVILSLPSPQILLVDVDESTLYQYFVLERGTRIRRMDYSRELEAAKEKIVQDALNRGILTDAVTYARNTLEGVLRAAGFEEVGYEN